jgi:hypothetical protein
MTELGDLLVLLHGARDRVSTVRAVVRTWQHVRVSRAAMARRADRGGFVAYGPAGEPERETVESLTRVAGATGLQRGYAGFGPRSRCG